MVDKIIKTEVQYDNPTLDPDESIILEAHNRFTSAEEHWQEYRKQAADALRFLKGEQFDSRYVELKKSQGFEPQTMNMLPAFLQQITNEARQNIPSVQIDPLNGEGSRDIADILGDLIRHIEVESKAEIAYSKATWYGAGVGIGYVQIISEYTNYENDEQKLTIKQVADPDMVFLDPNHKEVDGSDCEYAFIVADMTHDEYLRKYKKGKVADILSEMRTIGWSSNIRTDSSTDWIAAETVRVCEYYYKEWTEFTMYKYMDVTTGRSSWFQDEDLKIPEFEAVLDEKGRHKFRVVQKPIIQHVVINDQEVLESSTWPGKYIPIIPFKGNEMFVEHKRVLKGMIQDLMDAQRVVNYFLSWQTEIVSSAPVAPYVGTAPMFEKNRGEWADLNKKNPAYITFQTDPKVPNGRPERDTQEVPVQAAASLVSQARDLLKGIAGIYDPTLGAKSNETAGVAILSRIEQSHTSNYHFQDNQRHSVAQVGRVLLEAVPEFYVEIDRTLQLVKVNGDQYQKQINQNLDDTLSNGKYNVVIQSGPTYATKRQEGVRSMIELGAALPNQLAAFADIVVNEMDFPGAKEIAKRLKATVPPQILAATETDDVQDAEAMVPQLQMKIQQMTQQLQQLQASIMPDKIELDKYKSQAQLEKYDKQIETKRAELTHEYEMKKIALEEKKLDLEKLKLEAELEVKDAELQLKERELGIKATVAGADIQDSMMDHAHKVHENIRGDIESDANLSPEDGVNDMEDLK